MVISDSILLTCNMVSLVLDWLKTFGTGVAWQDYLHIYAPQREGQYDASNPTDAFVKDSLISPGALFQVKQMKYDKGYIITSLDFARRIFNRQGEITSLELTHETGC